MSNSNEPAELTPEVIDQVGQAYMAGVAAKPTAATPLAEALAPDAPQQQPAAANIAHVKASADPAETERARIESIMSCKAAKERPVLAQKLAFTPNMNVERAADILGAAAPEIASKHTANASPIGNALQNEMAKAANSAGIHRRRRCPIRARRWRKRLKRNLVRKDPDDGCRCEISKAVG